MKKLDIESVPVFYQRYVNHVIHLDLIEALEYSSKNFEQLVSSIPEELGDYAYASGKWTIKELLVHLMDAERIFAYRALRFSRNDKTPLSGFDENLYVPESNASTRSLRQLQDETVRLRASTIDLFGSFNPTMLERTGSANNTEISVLALGYVIGGHQLHHAAVLTERYLTKTV
jgi:hypothetical protein